MAETPRIMYMEEYRPMTPQQLYEFDQARGALVKEAGSERVWQVFRGPTAEEIWQSDEFTVQTMDEIHGEGYSAGVINSMVDAYAQYADLKRAAYSGSDAWGPADYETY